MEQTKVAIMTSKQNKLFLVASFALIAIIIAAPSLVYAQDNLFIFGFPKSPFESVAAAPEESNIFSSSAVSTIYTKHLQQAIAQTVTAGTTKPTSGNSFLTYENNSTLGIKMQYPANWERIESEDNDHGVLFLSPSESNSDRFLEGFSISRSLSYSNISSLDELASRAINDHIEHLPDFQLVDTKLIVVKGSPAYMLLYKYTDLVFGKAMAMDIGVPNGDKVFVLSYLADPAKFSFYLPTIQKMIDSFEIENIVNHFVEHVAPAGYN
jgi:hypothetical protein